RPAGLRQRPRRGAVRRGLPGHRGHAATQPGPVGGGTMSERSPALIWIARHAIAIAICVMFLAPVVTLALTSLMSSNQALTADLVPRGWHFENSSQVFSRPPMGRYLLNTVIYAGSATALMLLASIPAAY